MANYSTRDIKRYRTVTNLRIQYMCEYRLFLKKRFGGAPTKAARRGTRLHSEIAVRHTPPSRVNIPVLLFVGLMTVLAAIFWMLG